MKTLFLALALFTITSQQFFAEQVINQLDATTEKTGQSDGVNFIVASTDSYYSEALLKMEVKTLINQYSDVTTVKAWQRTDDGGIQIQLSVDGETLIIDYTESIQKIFIAW